MIIIRAKGVGATRPIARVGDGHNCHKISKAGVHKGGKIYTGSGFTKINGMAAARVGDKAHCLTTHDKIKKGVDPITVSGIPIAIQSSKCEHGGIVTSGSPNVFVGERLPPQMSKPIAPGSQQPTQTPGKHWIQGQYLNSDGTPVTNLPYSIIHEDGTTQKGELNGSGQTAKVTGLHQGTATIHFGNRPKLEQQLAQERTQLKQYLDQILAKTKAAAQKQREKYAHESFISKYYATNVAFDKGLAEGAIHLVEGTAKGVADIFKDIAQTEAMDDEGMAINSQDAFGENVAQNQIKQQQLQQEAIKQGQAMYGPIVKGVKLMELLYQDPKTRQILETFAENYYHSETPIMQSHQAGELVGGIIPGIVVAAITKNPELVAPDIAGEVSGELAGVATEANKIEKTLAELKKCKTIEEADVDKEHKIITRPDGIDEGAVHVSQAQKLDGYETKEDLAHPAGEAHNLDQQEAKNFHGKPTPTTLKPGTKIYRIIDDNLKPNGRYWVRELPDSKPAWRSEVAVKGWNDDGYYVEYTVQKEIPAWEGPAASQSYTEEGNPSWMQTGGGEQIFIPQSATMIPRSLIKIPTNW